jgi:hypothetical protein
MGHAGLSGRFATAAGGKILPICQIIDPIFSHFLKKRINKKIHL